MIKLNFQKKKKRSIRLESLNSKLGMRESMGGDFFKGVCVCVCVCGGGGVALILSLCEGGGGVEINLCLMRGGGV